VLGSGFFVQTFMDMSSRQMSHFSRRVGSGNRYLGAMFCHGHQIPDDIGNIDIRNRSFIRTY
jgi:hypothetical protein